MSWLTGVGLTPYGRHEGHGPLDLMMTAAMAALEDAGLARPDVDGLITGYSTTLPHLMLSAVFAERFGLQPAHTYALQVGGATGLAMLAAAVATVAAGQARHVLVVAGDNRLSGLGRDGVVQALAQVGHPAFEVPFGPTIPAYYALVASAYMHATGLTEEDLAEFAVLMRAHAARHPGAQFRETLTVAEVMGSRSIATPLKLLDCCPVSDGAAAFVVSAERLGAPAVRVRGCGGATLFQHVSTAPSLLEFGAARSLARASAHAGMGVADAEYLGIYDSFTITLAILLEELGVCGRGESAVLARDGAFGLGGRWPLNTHGGLLSYGHCGSAGAIAHLVEAVLQLRGQAGPRQAGEPATALLHGDGGVLSAHVTAFLERVA